MFTYAKGQDKIITLQNDTIFCKIVSVSLEYIKFEQKENGLINIPMKQVQEYSLGLRSESSSLLPSNGEQVIKPAPTLPDKQQTVKPFSSPEKVKEKSSGEPFSRWRIGFQGGGSYLVNSLSPFRQALKDMGVSPESQADDFYKQLRQGLSAGADAHYLINQYMGIGAKYSFFTSSHQADYTAKDNTAAIPTYLSVNEKENFYLQYMGLSFLVQQWLDENHKFRLNEELSVGYFMFRDELIFDSYQYVFVNPDTKAKQNGILREGNTYGGTFQISLEYYPVSEFSVALSAGVALMLPYSSLKVSDSQSSVNQDFSIDLDLSRIDYSLGIRFHF